MRNCAAAELNTVDATAVQGSTMQNIRPANDMLSFDSLFELADDCECHHNRRKEQRHHVKQVHRLNVDRCESLLVQCIDRTVDWVDTLLTPLGHGLRWIPERVRNPIQPSHGRSSHFHAHMFAYMDNR